MPDAVMEREKRMRLFVIDELSGDPGDWAVTSERRFVIAASSEEALAICDGGSATEVAMEKSFVLH